MDRPELMYLETFQAVVVEGGFGKAATALGVTQPAVSYRVRRLEERLGVRVFERPRRRVILTQAGKSLEDFCARFLTEFDALAEDLRAGSGPASALRIACPGAFGRNVVFPVLQSPQFDGLAIELLFRSLDDIFGLVESGAVDLGVAYDVRVTSNLEFREIATEEFVLIAPTSDLQRLKEVSVDSVARLPFVTYEECDYVFGKWFDDVFGSRPISWTTGMRFSRMEEVVAMVTAGRGWSIVPSHAVRQSEDTSGITIVRPQGRPLSLNREYAVTRPGWKSSVEAEALLRAIREGAPGLGQEC